MTKMILRSALVAALAIVAVPALADGTKAGPQVFRRCDALLTAASGTYVVPANVYQIELLQQAAGGGSGGVSAAANASTAGASAGEYSNVLLAVTPGESISYSQDATGGAPGAAGANAGSDAGNSVFGPTAANVTITGKGGFGTAGSSSGAGAVAATATLSASRHWAIPSASVTYRFVQIPNGNTGASGVGGQGGATPLGWSSVAFGAANSAGSQPSGYGSGASGAGTTSGASALAGGRGAPGAMQVCY